jgi:uncharacterized protein (DUF697 family)
MSVIRGILIALGALLILWVVLGLLLRLMALLFILVALLLIGGIVAAAIYAAVRR